MKKNKSIDSLRGLAILCVVLYHLPQHSLKGGLHGVTILLVLSGYLIARSSFLAFYKGRYHLMQFYQKRLKRIYPFLLFIVAVVIIFVGLVYPRLIGGIKGEIWSILGGYNNWWQIQQGVSYFDHYSNSSLFKHIWSLALELQFYLLWSFYFLLIRNLSKKQALTTLYGLIGISIVLNFVFKDQTRLYYGLDTRLYSFMLGIWAFIKQTDIVNWLQSKKQANLMLAGLMGLLMGGLIFEISWLPFVVQGVGVSFITAILLAITVDSNSLSSRLLAKSPLHYFSHYSYELYLIHFPVLVILSNLQVDQISWVWIVIDLLVVAAISFVLIIIYQYSVKQLQSWHSHQPIKVISIAATLVVICGLIIWQVPDTRLTADDLELQALLAANKESLAQQQEVESTQDESNETAAPSDETAYQLTLPSTTKVLMIGDSVMLGATENILEHYGDEIYLDAAQSRQIWHLADILNGIANLDSIPTIVIGLGTNSPTTEAEFKKIMEILSDHQVYWVNTKQPLSEDSGFNEQLSTFSQAYNNVTIIDWHSYSKDNPQWFYNDLTHLNGEGRQAYVDLLSTYF